MPPERPSLHVIDTPGRHDVPILSRMLTGSGGRPELEYLEARRTGESVGPPILLIHGAFGGAWMWREIFMPFLVRSGRHVAAVSLRGHGSSRGYERLSEWRLADFADDVRRACAELPEPPVLVGHSLGGLVSQMLIGRMPMRALVLLASLPPEGMLFLGARLAATDPQIWVEAYLGSVARVRLPIETTAQRILFSDKLPLERVLLYSSRMTPESARALAEAHMPGPVMPAAWTRTPTLVIGGELDRLVSTPSVLRTALYHGAEHRIVSRTGHFPQLDLGAEEVAETILAWIDREVGRTTA